MLVLLVVVRGVMGEVVAPAGSLMMMKVRWRADIHKNKKGENTHITLYDS